MPVYVYKNLKTGERFEIEQRIAEPPLEEHPETGDPVKRLVQPVGIAFKGSGFYKTDSRTKGGASTTNGSAAVGAKDAPAGASTDGGKKEGGKAATESSATSKASAADD